MERTTSSEQGDIVPGLMWRDKDGNSGLIRKTDVAFENLDNPGVFKVNIDQEMKDVFLVTPEETDTRSSQNTVSTDAYTHVTETKSSAAPDEGLMKLNGVFGRKRRSSPGETRVETSAAMSGVGELDVDLDDSTGEYPALDVHEGDTNREDDDDATEEETTMRRKRNVGAKALAIVVGAGVGLAGLYGVSVAGTSHVTEGTMSPSVKDFVIDLIPGNDK